MTFNFLNHTHLSERDLDRIIEMAWEDRTPFEAIEFQFQIPEKEMSTSDRVKISREMKALILELNEIYKAKKDSKLMDIMKRLTVIKQKVEKRLKFNPML